MLKEMQFYIEGIGEDDKDTFYKGFTKGNHWNGWACPMFTKEVATKIMNDFNTECQPAHYDEEKDTFIFVMDPDDEEATYEFVGFDVVFNDETFHVYGIGAYCWVWDEYTEEEMNRYLRNINEDDEE